MKDTLKLKKFFDQSEENMRLIKEIDERNFIDKIINNARDFLLNGKLELFLMKIKKKNFLEYFEQFCEIENLDQILSAVSFSLSLINKENNEV